MEENIDLPDLHTLDGPIPGQSLTDEPGNAPWEKPPQFSHVDEACDYVFQRLTTKPSSMHLVAALEAGLPVEAIVRTLLMAGFMEGKWTPDMAILMGKPLIAMIMFLAKVAGVENVKTRLAEKGADPVLVELERMKKKQKGAAPEMQNAEAVADIEALASDDVMQDGKFVPPSGGLMSPRGMI